MESSNENISKLILLINNAAATYQEVSKKYADDQLENFFKKLTRNHKVFLKKAGKKYYLKEALPVQNQLKAETIFNTESAIDQLILCKELEKEILAQAREAVHSNGFKGNQKQLICRQLTFSEDALFKADQMLEIYE